MLALPMVQREMQVAARRRLTFGIRLLAAALGLLVTWFTLLSSSNDDPSTISLSIFVALSFTAWLLALSSGLWLTTDSISAEKREGTLGLLFLTDLRSHDVLLGKLTAHALQGLSGLLALVPVMCLPLLLGGRTAEEIGLMVLALWTTLFLSLSVGLGISALCVRLRTAFVLTTMLLFSITLLPPLAGNFLHYIRFHSEWGGQWIEEWMIKGLYHLTPFYALMDTINPFSRQPAAYWTSVGANHAIALLALLGAWWRLPRSWQIDHGHFKTGSWREFWHRFRTGSRSWRQAYRRRALARNPGFWLAARDRWGPYLAWFPVLIAAMWWAWGLYHEGWDWVDSNALSTTTYLLAAYYKLWLAWRASLLLGEERREQTLEWLLTSPLHPEQLLRGQWQALWQMFRGPLFFLAGLFTASAIYELHSTHRLGEEPLVWILFRDVNDPSFLLYLYYGVVCLVDAAALAWLATWLSLRWAHSHRAAMASIFLVMSLPWVLWVIPVVLFEVFKASTSRSLLPASVAGLDFETIFHTAMFLLIHLGLSLFWLFYARWRLHRYFRLVAATPVGMKPQYRQG